MSQLTSELLINSRAPTQVDIAFEKSPPWLVSTVIHLATLICLALYSVGLPPGAGLKLDLTLDMAAENHELELGEPAPLDIVATEPVANAVIDNQPLEVPSHELLAFSFGDLFATEGPAPSAGLLQGFGKELSGQGAPGYTSVFGLSGEGRRFVYVFDRSESMNSVFTLYSGDAIVRQASPLALAKAELLHSLASLTENHEFQIVFYNQEPRLFRDGYGDNQLFPATPENQQLAREFVEAIPGEGGTNHWDALLAAMPLRPDVIFLITDGEAKDDPPLHLMESLARKCRRKHIQVNVIHFSNENRPRCTLIPLAEQTRGQHLFIDLKKFVTAAN